MISTKNLTRAALLVLLAAPVFPGFRATAATYIVTSRNDSGSGTLRQAMTDANDNPGRDTIAFNIGGATPYNITPASALPTITDPVLIDGTTQPGFGEDSGLLIGLVGSSAGNVNGLAIQSDGCEIRALAINRFQGNGIQIQGHSNVVAGCYLGTSLAGTTEFGNAAAGVTIVQGAHNQIGGTNAAERNLLSGNGTGVYIVGLLATNNRVIGNFIGTDATGSSRLANSGNGVLLSAPYNWIGGTNISERNVISGNGQSGVYLNDLGSTGNRVLGNIIGLRVNGTTALSNVVDGVTIFQARENVIGGPGAGNVISGNHERGILIVGANAVNNHVEGNFIGTDVTGRVDAGNRFSGVGIVSGRTNVIGGTDILARNVISGNNQSGVALESNCVANTIGANFIGLDVTGTNALPNSFSGVAVLGGANNIIGGVNGLANVISGNSQNGVVISGGVGTEIQGNLIGTDVSGRAAKANGLSGVRIETAGHTVGGESPLARNVISGNANSGVFLFGAAASNNVIAGNFIGTDISGTARLGNTYYGVNITNAARNFIGTADPFGGNVISGNASSGINLTGAGATANRLRGNWIGVDATGSNALPNNLGALAFFRANGNFIGGAEPCAGNVMSGNLDVCVYVDLSHSNVFQGNLIGLRPDGTTPLPNFLHAIELLSGSSWNVIGGIAPGEGNRIANTLSAGYDGIRVRDGSVGNWIRGNSIYANGGAAAAGLGIDWSGDGVTATTAVKFPVLTSAVGAHITTIAGTLNGLPNTGYTVDFYVNAAIEPSGFGEGQRWLGHAVVTTGPAGSASFSMMLTNAVGASGFVSAATTDAGGTTSEFSATIPVVPSSDTDGDGLPDDYEMAFGLNSNSSADRDADADGDGVSNFDEFRSGTRANDSGSVFRMALVKEPTRALIFVESVDGKTYRVEGATEVTGPWVILADNVAGTGTRLKVTDPLGAVQKFYRARLN